MQVRHTIWTLLLRLLLVGSFLLGAAVKPAQAQSGTIRFEALTVEDGLSQSTVRAILQDSLGFLWFGTEDGLNKYDGYTFTIFKHDPEIPDSIADSIITALYEDAKGDLWIGTTGGLDRFLRGTETFQHFSHSFSNPSSLSSPSVSAIAEDRLGNLWIGTDNGLNVMNRADGTFRRYGYLENGIGTLPSNTITALLADHSGGLWVGTNDGLAFYDPQNRQFTNYKADPSNPDRLSSNRITSLFQDRFGMLWVGTEDGGLNRFTSATQTFRRYQTSEANARSLSSNFVRAMYEDQEGRLWIGGRNGINLYSRENENFTRYLHSSSDPYSLSNDHVLAIYADRSGVLWVGTFGGGVSKYVQATERFNLFQQAPDVASSLSGDIIFAILEDNTGVVWVGTMDSGINRLDPETGAITTIQHNPMDSSSLSSNDVRALLQDRSGVLWVGTNGGGLNRFDQRTGRFLRYRHNSREPNSLADDRISALYEDRAGNLWVGTRGAGLDRFDRATRAFTHFREDPSNPNSLGGDIIQAIYEDRQNFLWVGTTEGISVYDPATETFRRFFHDPSDPTSLNNDRVLSFYEAPDGSMWIGTLMGGLNRFDRKTETFQHYTEDSGLPHNSVYGILADSAGYLWLSTNRGLSRFDPRTETFRNYDRRDGLQSNEFSPGAYFQNEQGWMFFGGVQGFNTFDPSKVRDNPVAPLVVITAFKKFNQTERKDLRDAESIELSYQDNFISFEFAALDYTAPDKNRYAYKLEGFDKDWIEAGTRRYTSYTNLRGGRYVFRVIGSNPDGVWNNAGASVEIIIVPPLWERWWFIASMVLLLAGLVGASYRLRVMRIQAQNRQLEKQVQERTQEIERRREVAEGLREILAILNSNKSLKESLDNIILQTMRLLDTRAVVIFRCRPEGYPSVLASNLYGSLSASGERDGDSLPEWISLPILQGTMLICNDIVAKQKTNPEIAHSVIGRYGALIGAPISVNDNVDGGIVLLYANMRAFYEEEIKMAASFADHAALAIANAELRSQAEEIAVSAERSRLARDLHDAVTQTLFATSLIAEVLPRLWERNPEAGKQKVDEIRELTRGALAEMRTLLMELRPTALEDVPLPELLQQLCEAFTGRARVPVSQQIERPVQLPSNVKIGFYRIAQEALNNVQKHARASNVLVQLHETDCCVTLTIRDDGIGFDPHKISPDHFGLGIMDERAQSLGARFAYETCIGEGTAITVTWEK